MAKSRREFENKLQNAGERGKEDFMDTILHRTYYYYSARVVIVVQLSL